MSGVKADTAAQPATEAAATAQDGASTVPSQAAVKATPPTSIDLEQAKLKDFHGELATNDSIPSDATLAKVADYPLLDKHGKSYTFKSLYNSRNGARRVLVVFVRHFFCGMCQEYIRSLAESISNEALLSLPVSTSIVVIGCGSPNLIDMYVEATRCPYPLYTDPRGALFAELGMVKSLTLGEKPAYVRTSFVAGFLRSVGQSLRQLPRGLALKSGDQRQNGGEFLFEPLDLVTPMATPKEGAHAGAGAGTAIMDAFGPQTTTTPQPGDAAQLALEEKKVTWCHRMRSTRDHAEVPEIMELLGLDGHGQKTIQTRKGTGFSMASQMNELKAAQGKAESKA